VGKSVFAFVTLINQQTLNFSLFMILAQPGNDRKLAAGAIGDMLKYFKTQLKSLYDEAQNKGTTLHLGTGSTHENLYVRTEVISNNDWVNWGGEQRRVVVDGNGRVWSVNSSRELYTKLPGGNWIKPTNKKFDDISVRTKSNKLVTVRGFDKDDRTTPFHSNDWDENKKPARSVPPKPDEITKWNRKDFFVYRNFWISTSLCYF